MASKEDEMNNKGDAGITGLIFVCMFVGGLIFNAIVTDQIEPPNWSGSQAEEDLSFDGNGCILVEGVQE